MITLRKHQEAAVEKARHVKHLALFADCGTGKTGIAIRILCEEYTRQQRLLRTLIFAPLSVCSQWKTEFALFAPKIPQESIHILTGTGASRVKVLQKEHDLRRACVVVTNYEAMLIGPFYELLLQWNPILLVGDESHRWKDVKSARHRRAKPLAFGAERRILLTGTPMPNGLMDIYGQMAILNPEIFTHPDGRPLNDWTFKHRFFFNKNQNAPAHVTWPEWVPKPGAEKLIGDLIAPHSFQAKKSECLDLPPLIETNVEVELSGPQAKAYKSMEKTFVAELKEQVSIAEFAMTKTIRLQQIIAGFLKPIENKDPVWFDDNPRIDALKDRLESIGKAQVIIWTVFQPSYRAIAATCEKLGITYGFIVGEDDRGHHQTITERMETIAKFKKGEIQAIISNPAAGSEGINLQEAKYSIYYARSYNALHYEQSKGRNYRGGSEMHESVIHYHLIAKGTIDEVIMDALQNKIDLSTAVLNWARKSDKTLDNRMNKQQSQVQGVTL